MEKKMKLSTKIAGGFIAILLLTAVVGGIGINGLNKIKNIVGIADDANRLIKFSKDCRIEEKNFIMRGDLKFQEENAQTIAKINDQIEKTIAKLDNQNERDALTTVKKSTKVYKENFDQWIGLWHQQKTYEDAMVENARNLIAECEKIRAIEKAKINEDLNNSELSVAQKQERIWKADSANRLIKLALDCRIQEKNFIMRGEKVYQQENNETISKIYALCNELSSKITKQTDRDQVTKVQNSAQNYKRAFDSWIALWDKQQVAEENMVVNARELAKKCEELREVQAAQMKATTARSIMVMISIAVIAIITGSLLAFFITRGIILPINKVIAGLTEGSEQVAAASGQVSTASQSLAEGATEQAAGLEETSSSLEEMASMTKQNADNAIQANNLAKEAQQAANNGTAEMDKMSNAINDIQKSSEETAKIIKVIDEIAFQTNLLALNAAVEAARAGEAGKGFAVVAEEVRNLAMRSAEAAKNTSQLIEDSVKHANAGVEISGGVATQLGEITSSITKVNDLISEIAAASQEQSQGIDQVNDAVTQMDKVTQQTAANAEESASASEELSAQAEQMAQIVGELESLIKGTSNLDFSTDNKQKVSKIKLTDSTFHEIANGKSQNTNTDLTKKALDNFNL